MARQPGTEPQVQAPPREVSPYDESMLQRAREQWRLGDWASLTQITSEAIDHHPQRDRLALLAAAGHHGLGQMAPARFFAQLAARWGCERALIARVLIGGVHNTLGRAAAASGRQRERALTHFGAAVSAGTSGTAERLLTQCRVEHQLGQMGLTTELAALRAPQLPTRSTPTLRNPLQEIGEQLRKQSEAMTAALKAHEDNLAGVRKQLEGVVKREVLNATKQLEAFVNLQGYLASGVVVPAMHGWPISPDFGLLLIELLEANDYDLVIEFGSGTSTLLMARILANLAARRVGKAPAIQVAFEHLEQFHAETDALLHSAGLADAVHLVLAPLQPCQMSDGRTYAYYDCRRALESLAQTIGDPISLRLLVMVDGPPGTTGPNARYPALAAVLEHFRAARIDVVLDDYARADEKVVAQRWMEDLVADGFNARIVEKHLEKDACVIYIASDL